MGLLLELIWLYDNGDMTEEALLISYRAKDGWEVRSRGRATQCLGDGITSVGDRWRQEGRGAGGETDSKKVRVEHSGRIGGTTRLAARRVPKAVI